MPTRRPTRHEYPNQYARYVDLVSESNLLAALVDQFQATHALLRSLPAQRVHYRYASGKWTLQQIVGHVLDTERLFGLRLLAVARGDVTAHAVADEELWMRHAEFDRYRLPALADEFLMVRQAHVSMLRHLPAAAWDRVGVVGGYAVSVRALAYVLLGHERHHWNIVRAQYLPPDV